MSNQDWDIKPLGSKCEKCSADFADQQPYVSKLSFGDGGYGRADFCVECWTKRDGGGDGPVSVWRGIFRAPAPPAPEPLRKETAESLLRRLLEAGDESNANVMFILAVMLERRRLLVERDVKIQADGSRLRAYEHRVSGDTFVIRDPMLRLDQLAQVQQEVMAMLEGHDEQKPARDGQ